MKKTTLIIATTSILFAVESNTLAETVKKLDNNATPKMQSTVNPHTTPNNNPYYQGEIVSVEQGGAYSYLEIKEKTGKTFWVAVNSADAKVGDYVRFQMELVTKNFKSKALNRTFDELMFASGLQKRIINNDGEESKKVRTEK